MAATRFLLASEHFERYAHDPACGQGNIVAACKAHGLIATGSDLRDRVTVDGVTPDWFRGERDFLADGRHAPWRNNIICNPPYGRALLAEAFIRKACSLPGVEKVAMFLNSKFMYGGARARGLYSELPPDRVYPISPRPSCPPGQFLLDGGKAEGGVENFCWFLWCLDKPTGRTEIIWSGRNGLAGS